MRLLRQPLNKTGIILPISRFSRLPIPDSRFPIPDSRFPIPVPLLGGVRGGFRFPIPDSRFPIPDSRFPTPDPNLKNLPL
ncbi:hypothetical protein [Moorena producens]|uniref:hypothetical protein n=1 Tax=Moorena producens TaxID=1155739 RepID=UPI003C759FB5